MIQRIQTVWLLLLVIIGAIWAFLITPDDTVANVVLKAGSGIAGIAALAAIFLYKKRKIQLVVCHCIVAVWMAVSVTLIMRGLMLYGLLHLCCLLPVGLAIYNIQKDEKLVRSLDRLR